MTETINRLHFETEKVFPISKVDDKTHRVYGLVTAEVPDSEGEIADYAGTKQAYIEWSSDAFGSTTDAGQEASWGNMRIQHVTGSVGGKVAQAPIFDDEKRFIYLDTEPINDQVFSDIKRGFYRGFSQGGSYAVRKCNDCGTPMKEGRQCPTCQRTVNVRYIPRIAEVSYVDNPCLRQATYTLVKTNGAVEQIKYPERSSAMKTNAGDTPEPGQAATAVVEKTAPVQVIDIEAFAQQVTKSVMAAILKKSDEDVRCPACGEMFTPDPDETDECDCPNCGRTFEIDSTKAKKVLKSELKVKRVGGQNLTSKDFAHVGDKDKPETWKLPIHDKAHAQNALARFGQSKDIPEGEKEACHAKILVAAKKHGIDVSTEEKDAEMARKATEAMVLKGLEDAGVSKEKLAKSMGTVSSLASVISQMSWIQSDAKMEAMYENNGEGDARDKAIAADLEGHIIGLIATLKDVVNEETDEVAARAAANKSNKGETLMKTDTSDLLIKGGARKSLADHLATMKTAIGDHADAMKSAHDAHCTKMNGHLATLHKLLGSDEVSEDAGSPDGVTEPVKITPEAGASPMNYDKTVKAAGAVADEKEVVEKPTEKAVGATYSKAEVDELLKTAVESTVNEVVKGLFAPEGETELAKTASVAAGIGERGPVLANVGPMVKIFPVTKNQDSAAVDLSKAAEPAAMTTEETTKALGGDVASIRKMMGGVKPTTEVPVTLAGAFRGR